MRVHVRRRAQVGVPEQLLNEFQVPGFLVDDCRCRVTERMEPGCPVRARDAEAIQRGIEHISSEHIWIQRLAVDPLTAEESEASSKLHCGHRVNESVREKT